MGSPVQRAVDTETPQAPTALSSSHTAPTAHAGIQEPEIASDPQQMPLLASEKSQQRRSQRIKTCFHALGSYLSRLGKETWTLEVVATCLSVSCFVVLCGLLFVFQEQPTPALPLGVSFNAVVSILGTAARSSLLFATASFMGQCKWSRLLAKPRRLNEIQLVDDATRGPFGSLKLLFDELRWSIPALGAVVIVLALAFDPFLQQAISYPLLHVPGGTQANTTQSFYLYPYGPGADDVTKAATAGMLTDSFPPPFNCPTGNCTWPVFQSVGWCSRCENVLANVSYENCDVDVNPDHYELGETKTSSCSIVIPPGTPLTIPIEVTLLSDATGDVTFFFNRTTSSVWSAYDPINDDYNLTAQAQQFHGVWNPMLVLNWIDLQAPMMGQPPSIAVGIAEQCILTSCVRSYQVQVINSQITSVPLNETYQSYYYNDSSNTYVFVDSPEHWPPVLEPNYTAITKGPADPALWGFDDNGTEISGLWADKERFSWMTVQDNRDWIASIIGLLVGTTNDTMLWNVSSPDSSLDLDHPVNSIQNYGYQLIANATEQDAVLGGIADSLTSMNLGYTIDAINGESLVPQIHIRVRWPWIALPCALVMAGITFVILVLVTPLRGKSILWKDSSLVLLYHGFEPDDVQSHPNVGSASEMDAAAESTKVKFEMSETTGRIVLRNLARLPAPSIKRPVHTRNTM